MNARIVKVTFDIIRRSTPPFESRSPIPYSILLIEDDPSMGQVTQLLLETCGYEVTVAADGAQGLRLMKALTPRLVICDVGMPGMDGLEVLRTLRQSETIRHIPVIFLSGFISDEQISEARKLGVYALLSKPCAFEEMKQVIADCRRSSSAQPADHSQSLPVSLSA